MPTKKESEYFKQRRNPFVNQVICFAARFRAAIARLEMGRNPFVNQVICFAGHAGAGCAVFAGESQSLRESGHLFPKKEREY